MKKLLRLMVLPLVLPVAIALPSEAKQQKVWQGFLIDRMCMKAVASSPDPFDFVRHHTKDCVLMPACREGGFVLYLEKEKKWLQLDKKGNEKAENVIRKSKRDSAFYTRIEGTLAKSTIKVETIQEIPLKTSKSSVEKSDNGDQNSPKDEKNGKGS